MDVLGRPELACGLPAHIIRLVAKRLRILLSAYACEPGKGSEPEVGWGWALQMARFHDVTVLTRLNNRPTIEPELERLRGQQPLPEFVYHDLGEALLRLKPWLAPIRFYYMLWQRSARELIAKLHAARPFDLMHHVTFAAVRFPAAVWGHGVPSIWGPVGGIEGVPWSLLPWREARALIAEVGRKAHNALQATPPHIARRGAATTLVLASTPKMQQTFKELGLRAELMPAIGIFSNRLCCREPKPGEGPLKLLFAGNLISLKGLELALEALKLSGADATFTLYGDGSSQTRLTRLSQRLGLGDRVAFKPRIKRRELLEVYPRHDVMLFPSLHDTGGFAVIEAMGSRLPVICLDSGGPAVAVRSDCGFKVPIGGRAHLIAGLAEAIRWYDQRRDAIPLHGEAARQVVLREYDWDGKGAKMNEAYHIALSRWNEQGSDAPDHARRSHMGLALNAAHRALGRR